MARTKKEQAAAPETRSEMEMIKELQDELRYLREQRSAKSADPEQVAKQQELVAKNTRRAWDSEALVQFNVAQVQVARSIVEENVTDAMQSYTINAGGNRELIMRTTDDVYRNRMMMLTQLQPATPMQALFQDSMITKTKLDYLHHRNQVNQEMVTIIQEMADAIRKIGDVSERFYVLNEMMVEHCDEVSDENALWFDGELTAMMQAAAQDDNSQRVELAETETDIILKSAELNRLEIRALAGLADSLGDHLQECQDHGNELRDDVINLREKVDGTQKRIADRIAPKR
jgi:hypothetical protein